MEPRGQTNCTAFAGSDCIGSGDLLSVAMQTKAMLDGGESKRVLIFDDETGHQIEVDFRGTAAETRDRLEAANAKIAAKALSEETEAAKTATRGPGRPKLGVTAREVTLLPRHWDWLNGQPGGASVALRKLVEQARRANAEQDRSRNRREAIYRFMTAMTGNLPNYEEAIRALFAGQRDRFEDRIQEWPEDLRRYLERLAEQAF